MKKIILSVLMLIMSLATYAQDAPKKPTSFHYNVANLRGIGCTPEQLKAVAEIHKVYIAGLNALKENTSLSEADFKKERSKLVKIRLTDMKNVLTEEQKLKVEEINKKLKEEAQSSGM